MIWDGAQGKWFLRRNRLIKKQSSLLFWAPETDAANVPPYLPRSAAAGGGINTSATGRAGLTAVAAAVKALTTSSTARLGGAAVVFGAKAVTQPAAPLLGARAASTAAKALAFAAQASLGARTTDVAAKAIAFGADSRGSGGAIASAVKLGGSAAQARAGSASAFPPYGAVELLINAETAGASASHFVDVSRHRRAIAVNSVLTTRSNGVGVARFGGFGIEAASLSRTDFDVGVPSDWTFLHNGLDKWTLDLQIDFAGFSIARTILDTAGGTTVNAGIWIGVNTARQVLVQVYRGVNASYVVNGAFAALSNHTDYRHLRITCDLSLASDNVSLFEDGVALGTISKTGAAPSTAAPALALKFFGTGGTGADPFRGSADELRITRGYVLNGAEVQSQPWPTADAAGTKSVTHAAEARAGHGAAAQSTASSQTVTTSASARAGTRGAGAAAKAVTVGESAARSAARVDAAAAKAAAGLTHARAGARADDAGSKLAGARAVATAGLGGDVLTSPVVPTTTSASGTAGLRGAAIGTPGAAASAEPTGGGFAFQQPRRKPKTQRREPARHVVTSASCGGARLRGVAASRRAVTLSASATMAAPGGAARSARTGWEQADARLVALQALAEYRFIVSRRPGAQR